MSIFICLSKKNCIFNQESLLAALFAKKFLETGPSSFVIFLFHYKTHPSALRTGQPAERPTSVWRSGHDDEIARRETDVDAAVAAAEGALTEEGYWHTVRHQHMRKNNNKLTGTLMPGNGSLIGVEHIFDLYLDGCVFKRQ